MMENALAPLISVVVPIYNVEPYLMRCVKSVQGQTYQNLEIILVDDGSPDRCGEICDELAKADERIIVIHKQNGGLSDARNAGAQAATGKWITFVDSDDWISPHMVRRLWETCSRHGSQITVCDCVRTKKEKREKSFVPSRRPMRWSGVEATRIMLYQKYFDTSACAKLYPAALVKKYPYPVGRQYEDLFTTYKLLLAVERVAYIHEPLYLYWYNPNSIMNQSFSTKMFDEIDAIQEIEAFIKKNAPELLPAVYARKFSAYSQVIRWIPRNCKDAKILKRRNELWKWLKEYRVEMILDKNARIKNRMAAVCTFWGQNLFGIL